MIQKPSMLMKNNQILIIDKKESRKTQSGLVLPDIKWNRTAIVVNPGTSQLQEGDIVLKEIGKGTYITINDIEYEIVHIDTIMAKIGNIYETT